MSEFALRMLTLFCGSAYMTVRSVYERKLRRGSKKQQWDGASKRDRIELSVVGLTTIPLWFYMLTPWLDFAAMGLPDALRLLGAVITVASTLLFAWTHASLAGNWSPFVQQPPSGQMVTTGPYRFVRHPMYASYLLYNGGMWLLSSNWIGGGLAFIGFVWLYLARVEREEQMMAERFGDEWNEYASRTGRIVPKVG